MLVSVCSSKELHIQLGHCPPKFHTPQGCASQERRMTLENQTFTIKNTIALNLVAIKNLLPIWVTNYQIFLGDTHNPTILLVLIHP